MKISYVIDNRLQIAQLIACSPDTPRVIGSEDPFDIQEKVIASILAAEERIRGLMETYQSEERQAGPRGKKLEREQLRLVCFDFLCS